MILSVIICSVRRPSVLHRTVAALCDQEVRADRILISCASSHDTLPETACIENVEIFVSPKVGSCIQRNYALDQLTGEDQIVLFIDDDIALEKLYFKKLIRLFEDRPAVIGVSANVLVNGNIDWDDAVSLLKDGELAKAIPSEVRNKGKHWVCHGCNMAFRSSVLQKERFDEELPLYSYGEDYDISVRVARHGLVGKVDYGLGAVHLEHREGRVSEFQRGYSIVANNFYFLRKRVSHQPLWLGYLRFCSVIVLKEALIDLGSAARQKCLGKSDFDHVGRFAGRMLGLKDLIFGRLAPGRILEFQG